MAEEEYVAERKLVGNLEALDEPAVEATLPAAHGHSDEEALGVLEAMRAAAPDDPFWKGVAEMEPDASGARVRFHEPLVPRDLNVDGVRVECHLHDREALAAAREAAGRAACAARA